MVAIIFSHLLNALHRQSNIIIRQGFFTMFPKVLISFLFCQGIECKYYFEHTKLYSTPSPAISGWHLGLQETLKQIPLNAASSLRLCCRRVVSLTKSDCLAIITFKE
mmetsp:Transcript_11719/g.23344  ORF Transcript_11719/g.23344 Transcript_11719/m.23344 type:complete len:107 (+) Transcript_11719:469-789(+)